MFFKATCCWSNATTIQSTHKYYKILYEGRILSTSYVGFPLILLKTYKHSIEYNSIKWSSIEIFDLFIQYRLIDLSRTWCLRNGYLSIKIELQLICKFDLFSLSSALPFVTNDDLFIRKHYAILKWRDNSIIENKK